LTKRKKEPIIHIKRTFLKLPQTQDIKKANHSEG